jgi:hypothetical protein
MVPGQWLHDLFGKKEVHLPPPLSGGKVADQRTAASPGKLVQTR